jgi:PTS system nitrogen regulatory IIA component
MQLSVKDAARLLDVSEKTIYRWVEQHKIPASKVNDQVRFNRTELLEWATAHKMHVSPDIVGRAGAESADLPSLVQALESGGISYHIGGRDKPSVLKGVLDAMDLPGDLDRGFLLEVLLAREALGSTGVGDGIAIPHVRSPIVLHLPRPLIALSFLEHPIDFGAVDGKPVHALFTLISPTVRAHLHVLSRLSYALRDPALREALARQAAPAELMAAIERAEAPLRNGNRDGNREGNR